MERDIKKHTGSKVKNSKNPIIQMIEDKKKIEEAIKDGKSLSSLKDIKIASPL